MDITNKQFEEAIIRKEITSKGGGIEINLTNFGFKGYKMTAYQNYLGGCMLGRISSDCDYLHQGVKVSEEDIDKLGTIGKQLMKYYFKLIYTGELDDLDATYESLQLRSESAY